MEPLSEHAALVAAPPERVWAVLTAIDAWRTWMPGVRWAVLEGALAPGSYVTIKPERGRQTAFRIDAVGEPTTLALGLTFGPLARLRRTWTLLPDPAGTRVSETVAVGGPLRAPLVGPLARRAAADATAALTALASAVCLPSSAR